MKKIVNPCKCEVYRGTTNAFAKIEFEDGKLSICGVIGPMMSGNCKGSAGQCTDEIRAGSPSEGWTPEMLQKFCDIWDRWHLNDMRPCCEHQREMGWLEMASEEVTVYHYRMTDAAIQMKNKAEKAALEALRNGESFTPTKEQQFFASLSYSLDIYSAPSEELAPHYQPRSRSTPVTPGRPRTKGEGLSGTRNRRLAFSASPARCAGTSTGPSGRKKKFRRMSLTGSLAFRTLR